ncbi:MAG: antibiotic biosynthesis monooxygenase [Firmicutes bacterium]|nr:antibiotic biosynthesis monooxygenase [Bacillota bacterium]MBR3787739.1 antibiotic biosynthesis monooxygenase [Bacillota bacterium]MBR6799134.1 antibiotic biosynthesis monooxygenase [Bacillota bacterium]
MTNYYVTYIFKNKDTRNAFYEEVKASGVAEASREEDGCIRYEYYYHADSDNKIFLWEQWESREAQALHMTMPHFAVLTGIKEKYEVEAEILIEDQIIR